MQSKMTGSRLSTTKNKSLPILKIIQHLRPLQDNFQENKSATTGGWLFAVCQKHTAKAFLHTAKPLPCVKHVKRHTVNRRR